MPNPVSSQQREAQVTAREIALAQQVHAQAFATDAVVPNSAHHAIQVSVYCFSTTKKRLILLLTLQNALGTAVFDFFNTRQTVDC